MKRIVKVTLCHIADLKLETFNQVKFIFPNFSKVSVLPFHFYKLLSPSDIHNMN